jgi:hypothetical protein
MSSVHRDVQLVDLNGNPITADDQGDASAWPASNLVDGWHWEPGSAEDDEPTAAERADFESWLASLDDAPDRRQISDDELAVLAAGMAI